jgi:hypothetical protein
MGPRRFGVTAAIVVIGLLATALPASAAQPGIRVLGSGDEVLVKFRHLACSVRRNGELFKAKDSVNGWRLSVVVKNFSGFHRYPLPWKAFPDASFLIRRPGGNDYSNLYKPRFPLPPFGGAVAFPGGRKVLGLGFISAFDVNRSDSVAVAGRASCHYKPRR